MEPRFGADFSGVRLHSGSDSARLNRAIDAQAFTHGQDIYLGGNKSDIDSGAGRQLLAHELTHTIQQRGTGQVARTAGSDSSPAAVPGALLTGVSPTALQRSPDAPSPAPAPTPAAGGQTTPAPASSPASPAGVPGTTANSDVLPLIGEAHIKLSDGLSYPLALNDLSELRVGVGKYSTGAIPLGESALVGGIEVGADNPLRLVGQRIDISPVVVKIKAEEIAAKTQEREDAARGSNIAIAGAAVGGVVGGLIGVGGIAGSLFGLGPIGSAEKGGVIGGKLGERIAGATKEQRFTAEIEAASITAHFPLVYNPYLTLSLSAAGFDKLFTARVTLQTSLQLAFSLSLSLGSSEKESGTRVEVYFRNGRLSRAELILALTGLANVGLNGAGMLRANVAILPVLSDDRSHGKAGLEEIALFESDVFNFIKDANASFAATTTVKLATGSALGVKEHAMKSAKGASIITTLLDLIKSNKVIGNKYDQWAKLAKKRGGKVPNPDDTPHAGTANDPIPITYYKPLEFYSTELEASHYGRKVTLRNWPYQEYFGDESDIEPGKGLWVGVANENVKQPGDPLVRINPVVRGSAGKKWAEEAKKYDVNLKDAEIDHVFDLGLGGPDRLDNLWPISKSKNALAAKAMYEQLIWWWPSWRPRDEPQQNAILELPGGTILVVKDLQRP